MTNATNPPTMATMVTDIQQNTTNCQWGASIIRVYFFTCAYAVTFVVALIGNTMVIRNALRRYHPMIPFDYLIVNMATADIIDSIFGYPLWVSFLHVDLRWIAGAFGVFLCKLTYFAISTSITTSVLTFSVIAIDRYFAIVSPTSKPLSYRAVKLSIAGVWIASAAIFSTELYITQVIVHEGQAMCYHDVTILGGKISKIDMILKLLLGYVIPLLVMVVLYSAILRFLYKWQIPGNQTERTSRHVQRYRKKTVKKLVTIVIAFALCWLPVHVFHLLGIFNPQVFFCMPVEWLIFVNWLAHGNTALNPCLYIYLSRNNQRGMKKKAHDITGGRTTSRLSLKSRETALLSDRRSKDHDKPETGV